MALTAWEEAQRYVVGSLLVAPELCAGTVFQKATPVMFGKPEYRHVFEAALSIWNENRPLDPATVGARAGDEYIQLMADAMGAVPSAVSAEAWVDILREKARLAGLQAEALKIVSAETEKAAASAYEAMGLMLQGTEDIEDLSLAEMIGGYLDRMNDPAPAEYLHFGIDKLDDALAVTPGMFLIIGADSSTGKTALALQFAVNIAMTGKRVGFFSLETPKEPLQNRLMAQRQLAGIPLPSSQHKKLTDDDYRRALDAGMKAAEIPLHIIRRCSTLEAIRGRTLQRRFEVIFIDYVQLIDAPGKERWDTVTHISMSLHRMAQELGVTIVGLSQVTPPDKGKKTKITADDLRESRQLKQDADVVLLMRRSTEEGDPANLRVLDVAKNKDGRTPSIKLAFYPEEMTFVHYVPLSEIQSDGRVTRNRQRQKKKEDGKNWTAEADAAEELPF